MRFLTFQSGSALGIGVATSSGEIRGLLAGEKGYPGDLGTLVAMGETALRSAGTQLSAAKAFDPAAIQWLPPLRAPSKIICIGLNYLAHAAEGGFQTPTYPSVFVRFNSTLIGHRAPLLRPRESNRLDYEVELVAVIGRAGRRISKEAALSHVIGYSVFNDASIRDYRRRKLRNGPWARTSMAPAPSVPTWSLMMRCPPAAMASSCARVSTAGSLQDGTTSDLMIFDVATLISLLSEACTLLPGDILVTGTPAGVGFARKPPIFLKAGDVCEVEVEGLGTLVNPVIDDPTHSH